jgi:16S rRNA (guanine(1405)-N(7))-methyltransferase
MDFDKAATQILRSKKYNRKGIVPQTVVDLLKQEIAKGKEDSEAIASARVALHHVVAPYLGDLKYSRALRELQVAYEQGPDALRSACRHLLSQHASTRERLPVMEEFYGRIFAAVGQPEVVLDLACGLNPLAWPWMGLPSTTGYYAYDLHGERVEFLNHALPLLGVATHAQYRDILIAPPRERADVALILKEVHRFEAREAGVSSRLFKELRVDHLVVSFPTRNLRGTRSLVGMYARLMGGIVDAKWPIAELRFPNEIVYCIDKR